jgi:meckelin
MWIVFFWWYLDWGGACQSLGGSTESRSRYSPENYILRHFVGTFILLSSGIGHLLINYCFQLCFPLNTQNFIDLCCVSNISVFILDESLHGYYIHGNSPAGKADLNLDEILVALEEEGNGKVKGRGLIEKDNENLQTFELYMSYKMRNVYDGIYGVQTESMILQAETTEKMRNQSR